MPAPDRAAPSLAVVIPTHNRPDRLARAVRSALRQRMVSEIVVVDDGSDPPADLGELRDPRLALLRLERNRGVTAARNAGTVQTRSSHLVYLDDDDILLPFAGLALSLWARSAARATVPTVAVGAVRVVAQGRRSHRRVPPSSRPGEIWGLDRHLLAGGRDFATKQAAVIPRALLEAVGFWDEAIPSRSHTELFLRLAAVAAIRGHAWPVYQLDRGGHARLTTDRDRRQRSAAYIRQKHAALLADPARSAAFEGNHAKMMAAE
jgi:glycosyltransferase involved in cell wall biosynthesis